MKDFFSKAIDYSDDIPQFSLNVKLGKRLMFIITIPVLIFCSIILGGLWILTSRQMDANQENAKIYVEEGIKENLFAPYETLIYLNELIDPLNIEAVRTQDFLDMVMEYNRLFIDMFVLDRTGRVILTSSEKTSKLGDDYSLFNFFSEPVADMSLWARPVISSATSTVSYVLSLKRPDGICQVSFYSFDEIQGLVGKISTESAQIGILNEEMFFMAHGEYSLVENRLQDQSIDFSKNLQVIRGDRNYHLIQWGYIEEYHLYVVLYENLFDFYAPFLLTIFAFAVLYIGLYLLITYYNRKQLNRLHQDMEELANVADEINRGNYASRFKRFQYWELSRLAESFNRMTGALKKTLDSLSDSNRRLSQALSEKESQYRKTRERESELKIILENSFIGIIYCSGELNILRISPSAFAQLDIPESKELEGCPVLPEIPEALREDFIGQISLFREKPRIITRQYNWNRKILEISLIPVKEELAADRGSIIITIRDVTKAVEANAQLNKARRLEAMGKLAGGVAHDFNNILQVIYGYIDLLKGAPEKDDMAGYLDDMELTADKGAALVQQLLSFGRRDSTEKADFPLEELIREYVSGSR